MLNKRASCTVGAVETYKRFDKFVFPFATEPLRIIKTYTEAKLFMKFSRKHSQHLCHSARRVS